VSRLKLYQGDKLRIFSILSLGVCYGYMIMAGIYIFPALPKFTKFVLTISVGGVIIDWAMKKEKK
jgi:hypothetical protein